jgi:hypothetical protein
MDFTKMDLTKFDVTKMFNVDTALDQIQSNTQTALGYIPDAKSREIAQSVVDASIEFARAQAQAAQKFADSVKSVVVPK